MTPHDWIALVIFALGVAGGFIVKAFRKGSDEGTIVTKLDANREAADANTKSIREDIAELKSDHKEHLVTTHRHGEDIAALRAQHDLADKLALAIARARSE